MLRLFVLESLGGRLHKNAGSGVSEWLRGPTLSLLAGSLFSGEDVSPSATPRARAPTPSLSNK